MTRSLFRFLPLAAFLLLAGGAPVTQGQGPGPEMPEKKFEDFDKVIKGAKEYDGLFKLYQKEDRLYAEVRPD